MSRLTIIFAFCFQFICEHRRSKKDPHPSCEACRQASGLQLCTPQETCDCCQDLRLDSWTILLKARRKRLWRRQRKEELCTLSTPAPPADDQGLMDPPPAVSLAEPVPPSPQSREAPSQEVLEGVSQGDPQFSDISETSDQPKHVEVESVWIYTPGEDDESTDSELGELTQQSPVPPSEEIARFRGQGHRLPRFLTLCEIELFLFPQYRGEHSPSEPQVRVTKVRRKAGGTFSGSVYVQRTSGSRS